MIRRFTVAIQALLEPYAKAYYFGPERTSKRYETGEAQDSSTFNDVKTYLEEPYEGKQRLQEDKSEYILCTVVFYCQEISSKK